MEKTAKFAIDYKTSSSNDKKNSLLQRVYYDRTLITHSLIDIATNKQETECQLLLLGAGYDFSYNKYGSKVYYVDLPHIIEEIDISKNSIEDEEKMLFIKADLKNPNDLFDRLIEKSFDIHKYTIILVEVVFCYLEDTHVTALLYELRNRISNSILIMIEPCLFTVSSINGSRGGSFHSPDKYTYDFSQYFIHHGTAYHTKNSSLAEYNQFILNCGWEYRLSMTLMQALSLYTNMNQVGGYPSDLNTFDEYSSLALLQQRYMIIIASTSEDWLQLFHRNQLKPTGFGTKISEFDVRTCNGDDDSAKVQLFEVDPLSRTSDELTEKIQQLISECFVDLIKEFPSVSKHYKNSLKELRNQLTRKSGYAKSMSYSKIYVCKVENEVIGCAMKKDYEIKSESITTSELCHLAIHPSYRRHGLGEILVNQVISSCEKPSRLNLTVLSNMIAARSLYNKLGFQEISKQELTHKSTTTTIHTIIMCQMKLDIT